MDKLSLYELSCKARDSIESPKEALKIIYDFMKCGSCATCMPKIMFIKWGLEESETSNCLGVTFGALRYIKSKKKEVVLFQKAIKNMIDNGETPAESPAPDPTPASCAGTCSNCGNHTDIEGGYIFCEHFHNTTIADGFCNWWKAESDEGGDK